MKERKLKLSGNELGFFCLSLHHLLQAGIGTGDALLLLAEDETHTGRRDLYTVLARRCDEGQPLSAALAATGVFPVYLSGLVEVGENAGRPADALKALALHYEERSRTARRLRAALLYPAILLAVMLLVVTVLLAYVLPIFNDVYAQLGSALSGIAGGLLRFGLVLRGALPVLLGLLLVLICAAVCLVRIPALREKCLPLLKKRLGRRGVSRELLSARFAQGLAMGMQSGMPPEEALTLALGLSADAPAFCERGLSCRELLEQGASLPKALRESGLLSPADCRLLEAGLRAGTAETVMGSIADRLLTESEERLEQTVGRVEPALVLITSVLVGLILLCVMLPLLHIMSSIG